MASIEQRRVGLGTIFRDNAATWTIQTGRDGRADRVRALLWFYVLPIAPAALVGWAHVQLQGIGQILSGVSVFTALLFGLLGVIFNTGITLRKDGAAIGNAHNLRMLVSDLRANVTYAIIVGIALAGVLVWAAASTGSTEAAAWWFTPIVTWLFVHLALNLLTVLRRFRTAFNYITR